MEKFICPKNYLGGCSDCPESNFGDTMCRLKKEDNINCLCGWSGSGHETISGECPNCGENLSWGGVKRDSSNAQKPLAILNTSILTAEGAFTLTGITLDEAKSLASGNEILSAVGHQSTADILTELLGVPVPLNRIQFEQEQGQQALVFKLNGRPPEGKILTVEEIEAIGYKFQLLERRS